MAALFLMDGVPHTMRVLLTFVHPLTCTTSALPPITTSQEIELLLHGLPNIDMDDWVKNTEYTGEFANSPGMWVSVCRVLQRVACVQSSALHSSMSGGIVAEAVLTFPLHMGLIISFTARALCACGLD
jgi:hypothetical protein